MGLLRLSGGALVKNKTSLSMTEADEAEAAAEADAEEDAEADAEEDAEAVSEARPGAEHDRRPVRTSGFGALMARRDAAKRAGVSAKAGDAMIPYTICLAVSGLSISAEMRDPSTGSAPEAEQVEAVTKSITQSEIVRRARLHGETGEKVRDRFKLGPAAPAAPTV